ncbi:MAG TPA: VWA domain-containing protein, partial [Gemmobacter sp.]|nr:VWA domain-containing protein [Gemmobacter sp.]
PTWEVLRSYGHDYKCIFVGDAAMSPYEILHPGGANEHWNPEAGQVWLERACQQWPQHLWINPVPETHWRHTHSTRLVQEIFGGAMVPMTLEGIARGIKALR